MLVKLLPRSAVVSAAKRDVHSCLVAANAKENSVLKLSTVEFVSKLLDRRWALRIPDAQIHQVMVCGSGRFKQQGSEVLEFRNNSGPSLGDSMAARNLRQPVFYVVRDDLLHPLVNGNKARKLDALLPLLEDNSVTDVVTCGGCQSAHAAAVAVSCAERGLKTHLLLRGEQPEILTGYTLISTLHGNINYVERSLYARRDEILSRHANMIAGSNGSVQWLSDLLEPASVYHVPPKQIVSQLDGSSNTMNKKVIIINEGAGDAVALLGVIRLVQYLSQGHLFGKVQAVKIIVDAGTGTTAVGLGLGALCLGLPWEVHAVMLADSVEGYRKKEQSLISEFRKMCESPEIDLRLNGAKYEVVHWVERNRPRKFGNVLKGEVEECQRIAQQTGILVDPIYTLAAWELAAQLSQEQGASAGVAMLHTGGTLGIFGLAQRYKPHFQNLKAH
ncbi:D-cysteine desulfhydrase 2, mitochondrial isoform X1 [Coffea arabica]|uniref:D-cysteine desulfhydrase 2, mitochondrial isoform X1 n=1 Tax=Coffea arabica TaxID=13443 RepID=A0A6P6VA88_COFAR